MFGGIVFWPSLAGSGLIIWLVLTKTGYAHNFATWDVGYRKFVGLFCGFGMMLAIVYGLGYTPLRLMTLPLTGVIFTLALIIGIWIKTRS
jgi:hypothetical protein